ncbi:MAG: hypothetical protein IT293_10925 [Deltaproteobacteria bacterium]|nr:hypothetical protein [Deltaproteobacteria bacterium]
MERWQRGLAATVLLSAALGLTAPGETFEAPTLSPAQEKTLKQNFALCLSKLKGPYTENFCLCRDGEKRAVQAPNGAVRIPCPNPIFCAAYRAPWAEALAKERMYIANIFSRDANLWSTFPNHHDLVRGYVLEKYFIETHPNHKLAQMKQYRGLSSAEEEIPAALAFFEKYLGSDEFDGNRHYVLAYELQRRYFARDDVGQVQKVRNLAVRIEQARADFKPLKDAVHNQVSAGLIPGLAAYRAKLPAGATRDQLDDLIREIQKLTVLDESALAPQVQGIADQKTRDELAALLPNTAAAPVDAVVALGKMMAAARRAVAARAVPPADMRRLVDLAITAAQVLQHRGSSLLATAGTTAQQHVAMLGALTEAAYGTGLLNARERDAAGAAVRDLGAHASPDRTEFARRLREAKRVVEWAQGNAELGFAEVMAPWTFLLPDTAGIRDDVLRGSPLILYAEVASRLDDFVAGGDRPKHRFFGATVESDVRALNPGLAYGRLRVGPKDHGYTRDEIVALTETPADLDPAAGILTQGEGNVLSHVQLLARALGIPNIVLGPKAFDRLRMHDGKAVVLIATPGGRVVIEEATSLSPEIREAYAEYTRNETRTAAGTLGGGAKRLHIDRAKIDLGPKLPIDLRNVRRKDSGVFCGPKAAFLGELKSLFPDHVARGIVVPFGAYHAHYSRATVVVPDALRGRSVATPGEPLPAFVERTYRTFFDELAPSGKSERELSEWIEPRLEVIRSTIRATPLDPALRQAIRDGLAKNGLLRGGDDTVGCFVRSDTNVEDLDNFNGAGLNLTVFNRRTLDDIYAGLTEVWASPFQFRSFSWRQTLIDDPIWVLSSVVILESVPSEKSGVLVTADVNGGEPGKMLVATSEGVGGAVDGTSAETLLWSPHGVELLTLFKSPWRNALDVDGGSKIVPSTGRDTVLEPAELEQLVAAGKKITDEFTPVRNAAGKPKPWDIEFGFTNGKLWLFQCRPFLGNDELKNIPALAALDSPPSGARTAKLSLAQVLR